MSKLNKIVAGTAVVSTIALGYTALADADIYTVKSGDTLWDIAMNNGTTVDQLMKDNNLTSSLIFPGDQLSFQTTATQVAQAEVNGGEYKVVLGDTLFKIANQFGTTVDVLVANNSIENPNVIMVGQILNVSKEAVAKEVAPVAEEVKEEAPVVAKQEQQPVEAVQQAPQAEPVAATPEVQTRAAQQVAPVASGNKAASIYAAAVSQLGVYQDCTMLVTNALGSVGINYHNWPAGYLSLGTVVSADQAQPGDLIYYANGGMGLAHIAVYAGNGQAIHGGWNGNQTVTASAYVGSGPVFIRVH
ncbi:LysM peptidoglycan-binding domain-containing protein [Gemella sp. GH3]|uniref:LysM peptidoglycan-binding domain-containing protein n=1 Tax=unclassified Gemella TaxID=2624949 RepID=UPI0015D06D2C|nr:MULTISPECIES: LysM peptidoglycan-binding domain-containing protein [unclassified Gemella]MBF0713670.1 LysM peptidoglycan-binding domain-containing protein [Gemella sp. GH3.1]NYS50622.1 LysM peptidoglycan-binding domain-containing protein [Gemella sp. GH3]